jgi:GMP synthase (glutamine-hydrolysing)
MAAGTKMAPYLATKPAGNGGSLSVRKKTGKRRFNGTRVLILQNCSTEGIGLYETRLKELGIVHHTLHPYAGESFPPLDRYDAIIVGGTPVAVNQIGSHSFLLKEGRFLKRALSRGKHILGICFGAQLLARLLGAAVTRNPVMEIGAYPVRLTSAGRSDPLFKGFPQMFPVFHWHGDTFAIPAEGRRLAMDRDCPNQAFRLGRAVGLQFHLEVTPAEAKRWTGAYKDELGSAGKNAPQLIGECRTHEAMMAGLAGLLLDNFLAGDCQ